MFKIIATLILGLSFVLAQPISNPPCLEYGQEQTMMNYEKPSCPDCYEDNPIMYNENMRDEKDPRAMMETIRVWKLTEALNLKEDQSTRLFPKLKEMKQARDDFEKIRIQVIDAIEDYLREPNKFVNEIKAKLQEIEQNETKFREKEAKLRKEIATILTPEQQAKFMLFQMRFDKEMREMIQKAKEHKGDIRRMKKDFREGHQENRKLWKFW